MLMNGILVLAALGALGACFGLGSFSSLAFLWQLPLLFAGLWLGLVLLAFLFLVLWCLPISLDQPVEADSKADRRVLYLYEELTLTLLQVKIHTTGPGEAAPGRALPPGVQPSQLAGPPHPPHLYQKKPAGLYFQAGK